MATSRVRIDPDERERGRALRVQRKALGLNQAQLGEVIGVSYQQYGKFERGESRLSAKQYEKILVFLGQREAAKAGLAEPRQPDYAAPVSRAALQKSLDQMRALAVQMEDMITLWQRHLDEI